MGIKQWLRDRWPTLRDNATYDLLKWLFITLVGAGVFLFVKYVLPIWTTVTPDEAKAISIVMALIVVAAVSTAWAISVSRHAMPSARRPALPLPPPLVIERDPRLPQIAGKGDWLIDVNEILFKQKTEFGFGPTGWYVLVNLSITNRIQKEEPTVRYWGCTIGGCSVELEQQLPNNWYIERESVFIGNKVKEEIARPSLDGMLRTDGAPLGKTRTGWMLFSWETYAACPHNLGLEFQIHDALGFVHTHTHPAGIYTAQGEIKIAGEVSESESPVQEPAS